MEEVNQYPPTISDRWYNMERKKKRKKRKKKRKLVGEDIYGWAGLELGGCDWLGRLGGGPAVWLASLIECTSHLLTTKLSR